MVRKFVHQWSWVVSEHKDQGKVIHDDCLKCEACVEKCPKKCLKIS